MMRNNATSRAFRLHPETLSARAREALAAAYGATLNSDNRNAFLDTLRDHLAAAQGPDGQAEALTHRAADAALAGDVAALRLRLDRIAPPRKDAPVAFALPPMAAAAVADGDLTPMEAAQIMALVETCRRTLETCDLEARVAALAGAGR